MILDHTAHDSFHLLPCLMQYFNCLTLFNLMGVLMFPFSLFRSLNFHTNSSTEVNPCLGKKKKKISPREMRRLIALLFFFFVIFLRNFKYSRGKKYIGRRIPAKMKKKNNLLVLSISKTADVHPAREIFPSLIT